MCVCVCLLFRESSTFFSSFFRLVVSILCGSVHRCRRPIKGRLSSNFIKIQPRIAFSLSPSSCMFWNFFKFSFVCDLHRHFIVSNFSSNYSLSARNMFKFVGKFFLSISRSKKYKFESLFTIPNFSTNHFCYPYT